MAVAVVTYPSIELKREIISIIVTDNSCGEYQPSAVRRGVL